ncbi:DUF72 domain-containing protein [Limnochorda pilosa]|uniref:DUF72 domain-containing protein n=1 Tax=Limnochorda pilosa TaxID=1555112 RepID=A0A0K2SJT6_LIMPI|nr:DUF72 domain-containing protein [Limnochorda pilosa]BAS27378.1 hypothetical protein LIP_1531 [Limnochorda pilosa]
MGSIRVGTCAWSDHENFYPRGLKARDRLAYYATHFDLVEVDATYYHLQPRRNFESWARATPDGFVFNVKAHRSMTLHDRPRPSDEELLDTFAVFRDAVQPLAEAGKLRTLHFQFPPWFTQSRESVDHLHWMRDLLPGATVSVEFRHRSWFHDDEATARTLQTLRDLGYVHTICDEPQIGSGSVPAVVEATHPEIAILRLHGRNARTWYWKTKESGERFDYLYTQAELAEWAPPLRALAGRVEEVHVLFNNNRADYAVQGAKTMQRILDLVVP